MSRHPTPFALPLWLDGHPFLHIPDAFIDVPCPTTGCLRLRLPQCGRSEIDLALASARRAMASWYTDHPSRQQLLVSLGKHLAAFVGDVAGLLLRERDINQALARAEVEDAAAVLKTTSIPNPLSAGPGIAVLTDNGHLSYTTHLTALARTWAEGKTVIAVSHGAAPSALFALAELTAAVGFPAGVFNVLYGGADLVATLDSMV